MTKTVAQVLAEAADIMATRGKATGTYEDVAGCVCAVAAIRIAIWGHSALALQPDPLYTPALIAMTRWVDAQGSTPGAVISWSDKSTEDEVLAGLRAAAELAGRS
jgi:hypothetical protein